MKCRNLGYCVFFKASVAHAATGQQRVYERVKAGEGISPPKLCPSLLSLQCDNNPLVTGYLLQKIPHLLSPYSGYAQCL